MKNMRTPLRRVQGLGPAHHGTEHFWLQRVTAVANIVLLVVLIGLAIDLVGRSHATVISALSRPVNAVLVIAAMISVCVHMRIGMQVVIEDYVHSKARKIALLLLNSFFCAAIALASIWAVLKISFGP